MGISRDVPGGGGASLTCGSSTCRALVPRASPGSSLQSQSQDGTPSTRGFWASKCPKIIHFSLKISPVVPKSVVPAWIRVEQLDHTKCPQRDTSGWLRGAVPEAAAPPSSGNEGGTRKSLGTRGGARRWERRMGITPQSQPHSSAGKNLSWPCPSSWGSPRNSSGRE